MTSYRSHSFALTALASGALALLSAALGSVVAQAAPKVDKAYVETVLRLLPENAVTLNFVLARAYHSSDSIETIKAQLISLEAPLLQNQAPLDTLVTLSGTRLEDKNEPLSPFQPNRLLTTAGAAGVQTTFRTGTRLNFDLTHEDGQIGFPTPLQPQLSYFQTALTFGVSQSLWRDAFGYATRLGLEAGELLKKVNEAQYRSDLEQWALDLIGLYYQAWFSQKRVEAAKESLSRKERLVRITRIKARRGTAETPDVLQAQNALIQVEIEEAAAHQALTQIWRNLVISLNLPNEWLYIDPAKIPMKAEGMPKTAMDLCFDKGTLRDAPATSTSVELLEKAAHAAELNARRFNNMKKPDLNLNLSTVSNGVDATGDRAATFSETTGWEHPEFRVGVNFSLPLSNYEARANLQNARAQLERVDAQHAMARGNLVAEWANRCSDLARLNATVEKLESNLKNQRNRVSLEERRFEVGKIPLLNVIQAGDDATSVEVQLRNLERENHVAAWQVVRLAKNIQNILEDLPSVPFEIPSAAGGGLKD